METIGNIVYWSLEDSMLSMTTLECARLNMTAVGNKAELHMTNIDHSVLKWITEAIYFHAVAHEEFKKMNIVLERLCTLMEKNNKGD